MRYRLDIMYDGSGFCGWQIQAGQSGLKSVQGEITAAIKNLTGCDVSVVGSGRTDSGVHALGQVAHFDLPVLFDVQKIKSGLNFYLPPSIRIFGAAEVDDEFSARFSATKKTYSYLMYPSQTDNPLLFARALRVGELDLTAMQTAAKLLEGTHDFAPFMSSGSETKTTVRTIYSSQINNGFCSSPVAANTGNIEELTTKTTPKGEGNSPLTPPQILQNNGFYVYEVCGNGFLYNMVRKIVAALISVGEGKRTPEQIAEILTKGEPIKDLAPPHALYLKSVEY